MGLGQEHPLPDRGERMEAVGEAGPVVTLGVWGSGGVRKDTLGWPGG